MAKGKKTEMLFLSEPDMLKAGVLDAGRCVDVLDEMFQLLYKGDYRMGGPNNNSHGIALRFPKESEFPNMPLDGPDRRYMAMVAYLGGRFNVCGEKWYGSNVANPARGLPRSVLMVMLNNPDTCEPIALMSANLLSAMRTGSVPGVGAKYLARKDSKVLAVIGAGPINRACTMGIHSQLKSLKKLAVYDVFPENAEKFANWAKTELDANLEVEICPSTEAALADADVISVAASRFKPVIIHDEWLKKGCTVLLTGASEIDKSFWRSAKVAMDNPRMHMDYMEEAHASGDLAKAYANQMGHMLYECVDDGSLPGLDTMPSLGGIALGKQKGRENDDERIVLLTGGMPIEDVAWGYELYSRAKELGLGQDLKIWDEPHWF